MSGFPSVGEHFGDYRIEAELGRGGMGLVFLATQLSLNRPVALKVLDPRLAGDAEFTKRFEREANILARMSSPHIIQVYEHGRVGDCLFLATQYVSGGDLNQRIADGGPLRVPLALELTGQIVAALADAHAGGVIHRDVKPSNVLLTTSGDRPFAYLCDFGIAQSGESGLTKTGAVAGSWAFMAPERHEGRPATPQSDIYSAGCILWALITGQVPYAGTEVQMALGHLNAAVPRFAGADPFTDRLNEILARSLAKDPAERYPTAAAFLDNLNALLGMAATATGMIPRADVDDHTRIRPAYPAPPNPTRTQLIQHPTLVPTAPAPFPGSGSPSPRRRSAWLVPTILATAMAVVAGVLVVVVVLPKVRSDAAPLNSPSRASATSPRPSSSLSTRAAVSPAASSDTVLMNEDFAAGVLPSGWQPILGDWRVTDGRLQVQAGDERARISFGPTRPTSYRIELVTRFVHVANASRWINIGLDAHIAEDWGSVLGIRSNTTADNGLEVAQAPSPGEKYRLYPTGAAPVPLGVGQDHWISIEVHGTNLAVTIDGQLVLTADNLASNGGGFGFIVNQATVQFDNVRIIQLND